LGFRVLVVLSLGIKTFLKILKDFYGDLVTPEEFLGDAELDEVGRFSDIMPNDNGNESSRLFEKSTTICPSLNPHS